MRTARIGRMGDSFDGMGDFAVPPEVLSERIGVTVVPYDSSRTPDLLPDDLGAEVSDEITRDRSLFEADPECDDGHRRSVVTGLAVRRWIEEEKLTGFTFNFLVFDRGFGMPTVPFLEASKAMARGIGYAGEGDVLTSALVGSLAQVAPETTFTEAFCPDWSHGTIFLSHMGEINTDMVAGKPILATRPFPWTDVDEPAVAFGRLAARRCCLVNLAPGPDDRFSLIIVPGETIDIAGEDRMARTIHGWFRPRMPLPDFLEAYSLRGGTHHSALTGGVSADTLVSFARSMGWNPVVLQASDR
jgi:L-arabinose isomerase